MYIISQDLNIPGIQEFMAASYQKYQLKKINVYFEDYQRYLPYHSSLHSPAFDHHFRRNFEFIRTQYLGGVETFRIPCTLEEFGAWVINYRWPWPDPVLPSGTWRRKRKYVRQDHHAPKDLTFQEEEDRRWKKEKKEKDYRRERCYHRNPRKSFCKTYGNRSLRRWVKKQIFNEDYDSIYPEMTKLVLDPWDWD